MASLHNSSGVKLARLLSLVTRFTQYLQSYIQQLEKSTFRSEMHRPSSAQLWQIPEMAAFPTWPFLFLRLLPLDEQDTSYLAESASIFSFSNISIKHLQTYVLL